MLICVSPVCLHKPSWANSSVPRRTSKVTLRVLNEYKTQVDATTGHLQQHYDEVLARLDALRTPTVSGQQESGRPSVYVEQVREEKDSIESCLQICRKFQADFEQTHFQLAQGHQPGNTSDNAVSAMAAKEITLASMTTLSSLKACGLEMAHAVNKLNNQAATANNRLIDVSSLSSGGQSRTQSEGVVGSDYQGQAEDKETESEEIQHELDSVKHLLHFCEDASSRATPERVHVVEDITVGDDSRQLCVSTVGDLFKVKNARAGDGSFQFIGSLAPEHLHEITMLHARGQHKLVTEEEESGESQEYLYNQIHAGGASRAG